MMTSKFVTPFSLKPVLLLVQEGQGYLMCLHGHEKIDLCPCCVQTQQVGPAIQKAVNDAISSGQIKGKVKWCMRWPIPGFTNEFHPLDGTLFDVISFDAVPTDVLELAESESRRYSEYLVRCAHQYGG